MYDSCSVLQFKLTLIDSSPEVWRRVLVPDFTLESFHYVISYSFGWFEDSEHEFSQGEISYGPRHTRAPEDREYEHTVFLTRLFRRPGHDMRYVYTLRDEWRVGVTFEGEQARVPGGHYPCCIDGNNDGPPDGVGGISRYNDLVRLVDDPAARRALVPGCNEVGWSDFEPTYLDIGDINGALALIFPTDDDAHPFVPVEQSHAD